MKRLTLLLILTCALQFAGLAGAAEIAENKGPIRKIQRGFVNIALSPIEISTEMAKEKTTDGVIPSWFTGMGRGIFYMAGRMLAGGYDLVTFPLPLPAGYEPLVYPEFPWEHFKSEKTS